ncbi:MAG: hypothetical protein ACRD0F_00565, partial [Acidimicrobiales bacterium]
DHTYFLVQRRPPGRSQVWLDDELLLETTAPDIPAPWLLGHVNRQVVERSSSRYLILHAAAAARDGRAVVLPAPMESGKSTLVAGLIAAGSDYLTDEAAAIEIVTGRLRAFPKALSLSPAARQAVRAAAGRSDEFDMPDDPTWPVDPDDIRGGSVVDSASVGWVVFPCYTPGTPTLLEPLSPPAAVVSMADNAFNFTRHGHRALSLLAGIAQAAHCSRLRVGDLRGACALILDAMAASGEGNRGGTIPAVP